MKKILAMTLALTLAFGTVAFSSNEIFSSRFNNSSIIASAGGNRVLIGDLTYQDFIYRILDDNTVAIVDYTGNDESLVIPSEINGKNVSSIYSYAFSAEYNPETEKYESNLKNVTIPDSITSISHNAFNGTPWLEAQRKNNSFVIVNGILIDCTIESEKVQIPDTVKTIGESVFANSDITSVVIPDSVTNIESNAFQFCNSLENIIISKNVTSIGQDAFNGTLWLENQQKSNPLVVINGILIDGKTASGNVVIPNNVTQIGDGAFLYSSELTNITIPKSVTRIGDFAFSSCYELTSVNIPESVEYIGSSAFDYCSALEGILVNENNSKYSSLNGILFNKNKTELIKFPAGNTSTTYKIPESVKIIGIGAFTKCDNITNIIIPENFTSIRENAFNSCSNLKKINIPNGVTKIEDNTFCGCTELTDIKMPDTVTEIGNMAFIGCTNLKNITIPENVRNIGSSAFEGTGWLETQKENNSFIVINDILILCTDSSENIVIPNNVKIINSDSFNYGYNMTTLTIPKSVNKINGWAFNSCNKLNTVNYDGTKEEWDKIDIGIRNEPLINATFCYKDNCIHTFSEWTVTKSATCTEEGEQVRKCSVCGKEEKQVIKATGHSYSEEWIIDKEPTETEPGSKSLHCIVCGEKKDITKIHPLKSALYKAATFTVNNVSFYDTNGNLIKSKEVNKVIAKGTNGQERSDFWSDEYSYYVDTTDIDRALVDMIIINYSSTSPWCNGKIAANLNVDRTTSSGNWKGFEWLTPKGGEICECLAWHNDENGNPVYNDNPIKGENFSVNWNINTQKGCIEWNNIISQGGLFDGRYSKGNKKFYKENDIYSPTEGDAAGLVLVVGAMSNIKTDEHSFSEWEETKPATCTTDGEEQRTCTCGEIETRAIKATGHSYSEEWTVDKEPTATEPGSKSHHCTVCGEKKDVTEIPATGSNSGNSGSTGSNGNNNSSNNNNVNGGGTSGNNGNNSSTGGNSGNNVTSGNNGSSTSNGNSSENTGSSNNAGNNSSTENNATKPTENKPAKTVKPVISKISTKTATGRQIKPKVKVVVNGKTLKNGTDYTVKYGTNKVGKGTVKIIGKGKYAGKFNVTKTFVINPRKTSASLKTAKGKITVSLKKIKEAKKYQIQYSTNSKFKGAKTISTTAVKKSLNAKSKKTYYVRARSVNGKYLSGWSAVKKVKVK